MDETQDGHCKFMRKNCVFSGSYLYKVYIDDEEHSPD